MSADRQNVNNTNAFSNSCVSMRTLTSLLNFQK